MKVKKYKKYWAVYDNNGKLVCATVYKKGAKEVARLLENKPGYSLSTTQQQDSCLSS